MRAAGSARPGRRCGSQARRRARRARARRRRGAPRACADDGGAADGGRPPSHSHWSITHGQMRSVTAAGELAGGASTLREGERAAGADAELVGPDTPAAADVLGADDGDRDDRAPVSSASRPTPRLGGRAGRGAARALGEDQRRSRRARGSPARFRPCSSSPWPRSTGKAPSEFRNQAGCGSGRAPSWRRSRSAGE